jgi:hypothetical protein
LCKEVFDFFSVREVARLEGVSRSVRERLQTVHLEIYLRVSVVASEFEETWRLLDFIHWYSQRLPHHSPQTVTFCINSYPLKEQLCESHRVPLLRVLASLFSELRCECMTSVSLNLFKQQATELNEGVCRLMLPWLQKMVESPVTKFSVDSYATDEIVEIVS